jgi:cytochrome c-type biogenesis protein
MLPVYVSYFAAGEADKRRTFVNAAGFVSGFTIVFVVLGAFAGTIGRFLIGHAVIVNIVTGSVVIVLGLYFIGSSFSEITIFGKAILNFKPLSKLTGFWDWLGVVKTAVVKDLNFFSSVLFGIVFSVTWTPCVSAFLGSALMMASQQGSTVNGIVMLLVYSSGLGIPFIAGAVLIDRLKDAFNFIKRNYRTVNIISGLMLVIIGLLMSAGIMGRFLSLTA